MRRPMPDLTAFCGQSSSSTGRPMLTGALEQKRGSSAKDSKTLMLWAGLWQQRALLWPVFPGTLCWALHQCWATTPSRPTSRPPSFRVRAMILILNEKFGWSFPVRLMIYLVFQLDMAEWWSSSNPCMAWWMPRKPGLMRLWKGFWRWAMEP